MFVWYKQALLVVIFSLVCTICFVRYSRWGVSTKVAICNTAYVTAYYNRWLPRLIAVTCLESWQSRLCISREINIKCLPNIFTVKLLLSVRRILCTGVHAFYVLSHLQSHFLWTLIISYIPVQYYFRSIFLKISAESQDNSQGVTHDVAANFINR